MSTQHLETISQLETGSQSEASSQAVNLPKKEIQQIGKVTEPTHQMDTNHDEYERRFAGIGRVYGKQALANFEQATVMVAGIGGVGSWVVEALARSAVGHLMLIDMDVIAPSNINRQLPALSSTLGQEKASVMAQRITEINPRAKITIYDDYVSRETIDELLQHPKPTLLIDCTDDLQAKIAMVRYTKRHKLPLIVMGGAGGKVDPLSIAVADLSKVIQDPLLAKLRQKLRKEYHMAVHPNDKFGIRCVYSTQQMKLPDEASCTTGNLHCGGYGSATAMTCSMGMVAVAEALKVLALS